MTPSMGLGDRPKMRKRPNSLSVPAAGKKYWGLSRNGSYAAAQRGDIPVDRVGRLLIVTPRCQRAIERRLEGAPPRDRERKAETV